MENSASQPTHPINPPLPSAQSNQPPKQSSKLPLIVGILLVLCIAGVSVYYVGNMNTKPSQVDKQIPTPTIAAVTQPTQIPENAVFRLPVNGKHIEVHANALKNTDNIPITSISSYEISPDKTKLALLANGGINAFFLYISDNTGENITYVGTADEIEWSQDSKKLAYTSPVTDIGPHRFRIYEVETKTTKELERKTTDNPKYSNLQWSVDSQSISAETPAGKQTYPLTDFK